MRSELSRIPGVGEKRRAALFRKFHSVGRMRAATVEELEAVVPRAVAQAVYAHFHSAQEENES